jgi:hypothetical protein
MAVPVALCSDLDTARAAVRAGMTVVLVGADSATLGRDIAALRADTPRGAEVAAFVGDPDDEAVRAAASSMAAELFGGEVRRGNPEPGDRADRDGVRQQGGRGARPAGRDGRLP